MVTADAEQLTARASSYKRIGKRKVYFSEFLSGKFNDHSDVAEIATRFTTASVKQTDLKKNIM